MMHKERIWDIKEYNSQMADYLAEELNISPMVTGILLERGLQDAASMRDFLYGSAAPFHDPFLLKDMQRSVERIELALAAGEQITVYGDYAVDGISASSLLYLYLKQRGGRVATYIPQRKSEGYGLNDEALKNIAEKGTTLVITVDCGISGLHEVANAPKSLDIIITDHHTVPEVLPPAYAIINAKQRDCGYPFKDLSGVGIAFKLCQALEQRELVRRGLKAMETTQLVGLRALIKASGCPETGIASDNIGFGLAPRLNAVGRLEHAQLAVELLVTDDSVKAEKIAAELNRENTLRQEISRQIMEEAEAQLAQKKHIDTAIVLASEGWHQGVIGIVASRLVDKYHLPTILISLNDGVAKGSCRSIPALNLYEAIDAERDLLTQYGGHHQAAGLTLPADKLPEFKRRFCAYVAQKLRPEDYLPHQAIDCVLSGSSEISIRDLEQLALLEPCGCENQAPVFAFRQALLHNQRAMGKERNHLQFVLDKGYNSYRGLMWNNADLLPYMFENMVADVAFQPKINVWNNETSVQLQAVSIHQQVTLGDMRQAADDKWRLLLGLAKVHNKVLAYTEDKHSLPAEVLQTAGDYLELVSYREAEKLSKEKLQQAEEIVLLDLPAYPLADIMRRLRLQGAKHVTLLFNQPDLQERLQRLALTHPDREAMMQAYKLVMNALKMRITVSIKELLSAHAEQISEQAVKIMEELGFIRYNNGIIEKAAIKRCSLEDAPLYVTLQQERERLEHIYKENYRLSQHELLRC